MKEKKLRPVTEELVDKIINQDAVTTSYGCGSGSGSGSGSGCGSGSGSGCGCGSGSGSGSGDEDRYQKIPYSGNFSVEKTISYDVNYEFKVVFSGSFNVYIDRYHKYDEWTLHEERIDMNFSVNGIERRYGYDAQGKPIIYSTSGGSKSFPFCTGFRQSCQIDCKTISPEENNLYAYLVGELGFDISSSYMDDAHIVLSRKNITCNLHLK